jgi:hypothetical protein
MLIDERQRGFRKREERSVVGTLLVPLLPLILSQADRLGTQAAFARVDAAADLPFADFLALRGLSRRLGNWRIN